MWVAKRDLVQKQSTERPFDRKKTGTVILSTMAPKKRLLQTAVLLALLKILALGNREYRQTLFAISDRKTLVGR